MIGNKMFRKAVRRAFGWMMAGYLTAALVFTVVGSIGLGVLAAPQNAEALSVCDVGGACFTKEACEQNEGATWRQCGGGRAGCAPTSGCGRCRPTEGYCYPPRTPVKLAVHIGGKESVYDISQYLEYVYDFAIGIAGGLAGVMLMIGGFQYLTAGGDASRVSAAKKKITDSLIGLALVMGAFLILNTINPDLVNMSEIRVPMVQKQTFVACNYFVGKVACGQPFNLVPIQGAETKPDIRDRYNPVNDDSGTCVGMGCSKKLLSSLGAGDDWYKCRQSDKALSEKKDGWPVPPYWCEVCKKYGDPCSPDGASDECCTGFCAGGVCRTGEVGDDCNSSGAECKSGMCQTRLGNSCSTGLIGQPCNDDSQCTNGNVCIETAGVYVCQPQLEGAWCDSEEDCPGAAKCDRNACTGQDGVLQLCSSNSDCAKYDKPICPAAAGWFSGNAPCSTGVPGSPCDSDDHCRTTGSDGYNGFCVDNAIITTAGPKGMCTDGSVGSRCDDNPQCVKKHCFKKGDFGVCTAGELWDGCDDSTDCEKDYKCDDRNFRCVYKDG